MKSIFAVLLLMIFCAQDSSSQSILDKNISINVSRQRIEDVLEILSNKGNFYFSYHSGIIKGDSLVSFNVSGKTVKQVLALIFNDQFEFRESGKYIIIRRKPVQLTLVTSKAVVADKIFTVSGYVSEDLTGLKVKHASIFERSSLASALTDEEGHFKLRLKSKMRIAAITVSKEFYEDTTVEIETRHSQQLNITIVPVEFPENQVIISPEDYLSPEKPMDTIVRPPVLANDSIKVEKTGFGKFMISTRQKLQSINLKRFFTERPFQVSLTPGLGSHGKMSPQVINHVSLNIFGGYTAGTDGVEIGGLFNINKRNVRYFQAAGLINIAGGNVRGFQLAGINNTILDSVTGFQVAGVNNFIKGNMTGFQLAGVYNHVTHEVKGFQASGVGNFVRGNVNGFQFAGVANLTSKTMKGIQVSGVINYARHLKGVQFGLINIADSSDGYSIGLINIILKGYHKLSFSTNEILTINGQFKTGNQKFYSILQAGIRPLEDQKAYGFGYGIGSDLSLNRKKSIFLNPEAISQYLYLGTWEYFNLLNRLQLNFHVKVSRYFSVYAGPAYSVFISDQPAGIPGYLFTLPLSGYKRTTFSDRVTGWIGFTCGINFF